LLDITATVEQDLLDKYGLKVDNAILAEEQHMPLYDELIEHHQPVQYIAGGAAQNTMRVAQWMMTNANGMPSNSVAFFGCVGSDDAYAKQLEECATTDGVYVHYMKDTTTKTGTCAALILKGSGDRALVANLAAANNFKPSHLQSATAKDVLDSAQYYYSSGFFLTHSADSFNIIAEDFISNNKIVCINLSAQFIVDFFATQLATAIELSDYVFGNESEAASYATKNNLDPEDLHAVALAICNLPMKKLNAKRTVVFTQGSKSTIVAYDGVVTEYAVVPLDKSLLVDTNGAGDAFVGGFLSQLVLKDAASMKDCVDAGHYAAKYIIQVSGTSLEPGKCTFIEGE
jgi:adenosine kinase